MVAILVQAIDLTVEHGFAIAIVHPDYSVKNWDTSSFSEFPIWNGNIDKNGDFALLSGSGKVFVLDKKRNLYNSFNADASWAIYGYSPRSGGGIIMNDGIIHILDYWDSAVKSYNHKGHRLYNNKGNSLFEIPPDFKMGFMQKWNGMKPTRLTFRR